MKKLNRILLSTTLLGGMLFSNPVFAEIQTDTVDEVWGKPTLVYGSSLSDEQVNVINNQFNIKDINNVVRQVALPEDMVKYVGGDGTAPMYSSVLVQKQAKGKGIDVTIKTPNLITKVTPTQYANAAITAGATDVQIEVAAPSEVTGESALTGVYKALTANGVKVDEARTAVAQEEVSTTAAIAAENATKEDFDSNLLDNSVADIKMGLAEYKSKNGSVADEAQVTDIVNQALKKNGLDKVVTPEQVASLVSFAKNYQNTSAIDDKAVLEQLGDLQDSISENVSNLLKAANEHGVAEKAGNFFKSIWDTITSLFSK